MTQVGPYGIRRDARSVLSSSCCCSRCGSIGGGGGCSRHYAKSASVTKSTNGTLTRRGTVGANIGDNSTEVSSSWARLSRAIADAVAELGLRTKAVSSRGCATQRVGEALHVVEAGLLESFVSLAPLNVKGWRGRTYSAWCERTKLSCCDANKGSCDEKVLHCDSRTKIYVGGGLVELKMLAYKVHGGNSGVMFNCEGGKLKLSEGM